jgi:GR25 family glycosyltransferase involved in LPS biosynthesis
MHILNQKFQQIYCLNLERRTDRKENAAVQFASKGIEASFFRALDGKLMESSIYKQITQGAVGAFHSHLQILKHAYHNNLERILVFEDDIKFENGFDECFEMQLNSVPDDWDFLYLGWADFQGFAQAAGACVNEWVCVPKDPYGLFAYAVRGREIMERLITFFESRISNIERQYDEYLCFEFWPNSGFKMYGLIPPLIWYENLGTDIQTYNQVQV